MKIAAFLTLLIGFIVMALGATAEDVVHNTVPLGLWKEQLKSELLAEGISAQLIERALERIEPDEDIIRLDRKQPEGTKSFAEYLRTAVSASRIETGRAMLAKHRALLEEIGQKYGVQPRFIVALWGIETNYGGYTGNFSVVNALATLAYDGRRSEFFRKELINALKIIDAGHIGLSEMEGSWAGAMGQCQFMPSSFLDFAVDYNGDGRKDIWHSMPDIFASIANYLSKSGWSDDLTWGRRVVLPVPMDAALLAGDAYKPLSEWSAMGVRRPGGQSIPVRNLMAAISLPSKEDPSTAYLIYRNYDVLLKWNRSRYFASAVGELSDAIVR